MRNPLPAKRGSIDRFAAIGKAPVCRLSARAGSTGGAWRPLLAQLKMMYFTPQPFRQWDVGAEVEP
jgi:hypothetical protein